MRKLEGIIIPCTTPFDKDGTLRMDWLRHNYEKWNATHIHGYMALGSNGEFRSLSDDEAFEVLKTVSEIKAPDKIFIAGVARESLYQTLLFLKRLEDAKVQIDYISLLTPCYFKNAMTDEALIDYFTTIADVSSYPVLLYCAPGFANGVRISPEALRVLADHPNIAGIKDTTPDMMNAYMDAVGGREDFEVFSGSLGSLRTCLERGGKGGIISSANYFPETCAEFYEIFKRDGKTAAFDYLAQLSALAKATGGSAGVAGVKCVMNMMGYQGGFPRRPVLPCSQEVSRTMSDYIEAHRDFILD